MSILISRETQMFKDDPQVDGCLKFDNLLEIYTKEQVIERVPIEKRVVDETVITASGQNTLFSVNSKWERIEDVCSYIQVTLDVVYLGASPGEFGFKFKGELVGEGRPTWMIPGAFYKENRFEHTTRKYPRYDFKDGDPNEMVSDFWGFRSDRAALPVIFAWNNRMCGAICVEETSDMGLTGIGFRGDTTKTEIWASFPYREEPVTFVGEPQPERADYQFYRFEKNNSVQLKIKLYTNSSDRHAYDPFVRQMYKLHQKEHPLNPWMDLNEAAELTAWGLYKWHYNREHRILNETAAFDRELNNNVKGLGDREHMHVGWVSGAPYAHALLTYGRKHGEKAYVEAAIDVLDHISSALSPSGVFWASWVVGKGWGTGWNPKRTWLQARTVSEATLFLVRALSHEKELGVQHPEWERAVLSNLNFAVRHQNSDGNFGSYYHVETGDVEEWDGAGGILWIAALIEGSRYFKSTSFLEAAMKAGHYYETFVLNEYIYGAPEDVHLTPTSEDAYNAVVSYVLLHEEDASNQKWLTLAKRAADWMMTFRWTYNLDFPKYSFLKQYDYRSRGADQASPSNQHLHNYGLFCVPEMLRLWKYTGDRYYLDRTRDNLACFLQFIAREDGDFNAYKGMVTERFYNTNCFQPKGMMLTLSHSWCIGVILYATQEALFYRNELDL